MPMFSKKTADCCALAIAAKSIRKAEVRKAEGMKIVLGCGEQK